MNNLTARIHRAEKIRQTNPANALKIFKEILDTSIDNEDLSNSLTAKFNIAITYLIIGNYQESLKTFTECLDDTSPEDDKNIRCEILRGIGSNHFRLYNYKDAIRFYYLSEQDSIETSHYENLHRLYQDFGALYNRLKMFSKSLEYSLRSLDIAQQCGLKESLQSSLMSIGACYYQLGNMPEAVRYLNESLELSSSPFAEANALHFLSMMRLDENDHNGASALAMRQIDICKKHNYFDFEALGLRMLGDIMLKEKKFHEALNYFNTAVEILSKVGEKQIKFSIIERIISIHELTGNTEQVNLLYKQLYKENVEHLEKNIQLKIEQVDTGFETENIRKEVIKEKENNTQLSKALKDVNDLNLTLKVLHEEKNSIMGIVAHDLRNPIQSILSSARLINSNKDQSELVDEMLDNVKAQSKRMMNLIDRLMNISAIENGKIQLQITSFQMKEMFTRVMATSQVLALNKKINIISECGLLDCYISTDFDLLYQVLENLMTNAIKFSPIGKNIYVNCGRDGDVLKLEIRDEGPGFTNDDKEKLYSNFAKLSARPTANENSTGLGLAIVKKLCDILDAGIRLESEPGKGAKFIITISTLMD